MRQHPENGGSDKFRNQMKNFKHSLTALFSFCSLFMFGQNTIDRDNFFILGNSYPYVFLDSIERDTVIIPGNNAVWDFSNSVQSSQFDTLRAIDPATTIFYNDPNVNYNISNLCLFEPSGQSFSYDDNLYNYYVSDNASIHFIGNWANNGIWEVWYYHLTDPEKYFSFPFSLNDNFQDSFSGSSYDMSGSGLHGLQGTRNVQADGFGTLILPSMTYTNCLRIKSVRNLTDSSMFGYQHQDRTFYTWFQLNTNGYILEIETDSLWIWQTKYYYDNPLINGLNEVRNQNLINIFPNPVIDKLTITTTNHDLSEIILYDIAARKLLQQKFTNAVTLNTAHLAKGIYIYEVRNGNGVVRKGKVVKE